MILLPNLSWTQLIKKIAKEERESSRLCDYIVGTIASINPITIKISDAMELPSDFLLATQTVKNYDLQSGDKVLMIRKQGGQQYVIIDKVVRI